MLNPDIKNNNIIIAQNIKKSFKDGEKITEVLKGINMNIQRGEFIAIMGRSGAGKSTIMYQLSLLDNPTSGEIIIDNIDAHNLSEEEKTRLRLSRLGYVFQDYSLMQDLTALENIMLPLLMLDKSEKDAANIALKALESVGLADRKNNIPAKLSGGEQQRVSIARAIAHNPLILFADEPTANLDHANSKVVMDIFKKLNKELGLTIVMVTHEDEHKSLVDRIIYLDDGRVINV